MKLEENETVRIQKELDDKVNNVKLFLDGIENEAIFVAQSPILLELALHVENTNHDEISFDKHKNSTKSLFYNIVKNDPNIYIISYLDMDGNEIVKLEQRNSKIRFIDEMFLQNMADMYYFQQAINQDNDSTYVSNLDLNEEFGEVSFPYTPTIKFIVPVIDTFGEKKGMVVFNIIAKRMIEIIESSSIGESIMIDSQGYFLIHPENTKEFSLQLRHNYNYFYDQPELRLNIQSLDKKFHVDIEENQYRIWKKIFYNPQNNEDFWLVVMNVTPNELFAPVIHMWETVVLSSFVILSITLIIIIFFSNRITSPILKLKRLTNKIAGGDFRQKIEIKTNDEISELADSVEFMSQSLQNTLKIEKELYKKQLKIEKEQKKIEVLKEKTKAFDEIQKINEELSTFKSALDTSALVAITDRDGTITYANDMFCKTSKYSKEELLGKNHRILKSGHHDKKFYEDLWDTITSGKIWHGDICNKAKDGSLYWVRSTIMPILDNDNNPIQYIAIRTNISSQVELAEKLVKSERLSTIGQLSARMAHDIRNPLSIIQISLENLKLKYGTDEYAEKSFDKVYRAIDRITHQTENVLDYVKGSPPKLDKIKYSEIIADSFDSLVIPSTIKLILPENDVEFLGDKKQLSIVCTNLVFNAIQAMDGVGTIEISLEENKEEIIIRVKDSGKGIPKENMDKIFEPLFTTKQTGTGLGLVSVKTIIEAHGGTISVKNNPTTFTINLPKTRD